MIRTKIGPSHVNWQVVAKQMRSSEGGAVF